jgi:hypothetical protein
MKCQDCAHLDLSKYEKHAAVGFGQCKRDPLPGVFVSMLYERKCDKFKEKPNEEGREK